MKFYIRLLSYPNACKIIDFINQIVGCYANLTSGAVSVLHSDTIDKDMIIHELNLHYPHWEVTEDHPQKVKERIVNKLGLSND